MELTIAPQAAWDCEENGHVFDGGQSCGYCETPRPDDPASGGERRRGLELLRVRRARTAERRIAPAPTLDLFAGVTP